MKIQNWCVCHIYYNSRDSPVPVSQARNQLMQIQDLPEQTRCAVPAVRTLCVKPQRLVCVRLMYKHRFTFKYYFTRADWVSFIPGPVRSALCFSIIIIIIIIIIIMYYYYYSLSLSV